MASKPGFAVGHKQSGPRLFMKVQMATYKVGMKMSLKHIFNFSTILMGTVQKGCTSRRIKIAASPLLSK